MAGYRIRTHGGAIDTTRKLAFRWDGRKLSGHPGDTLASALLASGQRTIGRSFKYHRRRGIITAGVQEPGAYVTLGRGAETRANARAPTVELTEGLDAQGQNAWPTVRFDVGAASGLLAPFLPAGFYYKTFIGLGKGTRWWMFCERFIRAAAGMGRASRAPDPGRCERVNAFCDVLVVGAGPAGISAARGAAAAGLEVILVEQDFAIGGAMIADAGAVGGDTPQGWLREARTAIEAEPRIRVLTRTCAFGLYDGGVAGLHERLAVGDPTGLDGRFWVVRAGHTILATGAHERGFAFEGNDLPGVMLADAARVFANRYRAAPGKRGVIATNNDSGYRVATDLAALGITVTLCDARLHGAEGVRADGFDVLRGTVPCAVQGGSEVRSVEVGNADGLGNRRSLAGDFLAVSGGWNPVVHLACHRGLQPHWHHGIAAFLVGDTGPRLTLAGSAGGIWNTEDCVTSGAAAAARAATALGAPAASAPSMPAAGGWKNPIQPLWEVDASTGRGRKSFVDLQNDVTAFDIRLAAQEGFGAAEHLKRYTTLGMSPDQGKTGNVVGLGILAAARGLPDGRAGVTTFRPPFDTVELGALAHRLRGRGFLPVRRTPAHNWHYRHGAMMVDAGLWRRPWYYPQISEGVSEAYIREATTVRETVGFTDVSTLGKIAVQGPDAAEFLNHVYVNGFARLPVGRCRYGVMLRDDGMVLDDGTTWRLGEHEYFMTTTTAMAGPVMVWLEGLLATRFPELRVHVTSVSDQWAGIAIAGPKARTVLDALAEDLETDNEAFPFMAVREAAIRVAAGTVVARIARITYSGELGYEVYVPADHAEPVMDAVAAAVTGAGGAPYGLEALGALRIEKGHVTVAELDGRVTLEDAGLGGMASTRKPYIGRVLAGRAALKRADRPRLVGILPLTPNARFSAGSILCRPGETRGHGVGWVTAVTHSPALGHWIGLGFAEGGAEAWHDRTAVVASPAENSETAVRLVSPHMFDPEGSRQRG